MKTLIFLNVSINFRQNKEKLKSFLCDFMKKETHYFHEYFLKYNSKRNNK